MVDQSSRVETDTSARTSATETDVSAPSQVSECAAPMGISAQTSSNTGDTDEQPKYNFTHSRSASTGTLYNYYIVLCNQSCVVF